MLKARSGDSVKLVDLLDEAVARAAAALAERDVGMEGSASGEVARSLGIGAVKYADLSNDRVRDYVFDWERMLAFEGNTGPYLQYAHARIRSIFRRGEVAPPDPRTAPTLAVPEERALALRVLGFGEAVRNALEASAPSKLCAYLFDLATTYTTFYERCPVLKASDEETRRSRLLLSDVSARVLAEGLGLLGMDAPARM
jgi:arginyl-tRNA synthetase